MTGDRTFKGTGDVTRNDTFTARITAEVLDVKPNGTLVLQARKHIKTDEEEQLMVLTGTCRVEDVTADNTVLSTQLNDLDLQKNHKGDVREATRRGFLGKLLDFVNPF
ncbi:MAG TPA: flagellar basal body L-ring protein FlgH [Tepidisphaeraceae bacterium]|nr:flagellar basal body L-ring protein FlgH [Tepidisphaeraceae bacterium]